MKKIFLTSGVLMCMACPTVANADGYGFTKTSVDQTGTGASARFSANTSNTGSTLTDYANINTATNKDVANACVTAILGTGAGTDGNDVTLEAQWKTNYSIITLSPNTTANGWDGSSAVNPTPIYGIPSATSVYTTKSSNGNLSGATAASGQLLTLSGTTVTGKPTGKSVNHTLDYNWSSISSAGGDTYNYITTTSDKFTQGSSAAKNRTFNGIYSAASSGTQYIDANGKILTAGITAAKGYAADTEKTWYAQYNCATPTVTNPKLLGYDFSGWKTTATGTTAYTTCINASDTIYATWTPKTYIVTYNANKPSTALTDVTDMPASGDPSLSATFDRGYIAASAPSLTGFYFNGWKANYDITTGAAAGTASAPTQSYSAGQVIANTSASPATRWKTDATDVTFVAQWIAQQYTITLDKNGGSGTYADKIYTTYGTGAYLESARTNLMTTSANPLASVPTGPSVSLSFNAHSPTDPANNNTPYVSNPTASTKNRAFSGYYSTNAASGGTQYIASGKNILGDGNTRAKSITADETWYARWGTASTVVASNLSVTGYTFNGWYTAATGGTQKTAGSTYAISSSTTLHGQWTPYSGTITFNCGNGTGTAPTSPSTWEYDTAVIGFPTTAGGCTKTGYIFNGWDCTYAFSSTGNPETSTGHNIYRAETSGTNRGTIVVHNPNGGYYKLATDEAVIACTALWIPGDITVHWNKNNATSTDINDGSCTYDSSVTLPTNPTRTGYVFNGWKVQ